MCGHNADGAEWTYKTPRVVLMARSSKCETKGNLRAAFPNSLRPVTQGGPDVLPILHHASQLYQEVDSDARAFASSRAADCFAARALPFAFAVVRRQTSVRAAI
jgi:hypothetical protein